MKIYTRTGDAGDTGLFGGERVSKTDPRVTAYGTVDELNAQLGLALSHGGSDIPGAARLRDVQGDLLTIGAWLAAVDPEKAQRKGVIPVLEARRIDDLESWIDELEDGLPDLESFLLPGGSVAGATLHVARTVCRRAERAVVQLLPRKPELGQVIIPYLNRLSDLLFSLARAANAASGTGDVEWRHRDTAPRETG